MSLFTVYTICPFYFYPFSCVTFNSDPSISRFSPRRDSVGFSISTNMDFTLALSIYHPLFFCVCPLSLHIFLYPSRISPYTFYSSLFSLYRIDFFTSHLDTFCFFGFLHSKFLFISFTLVSELKKVGGHVLQYLSHARVGHVVDILCTEHIGAERSSFTVQIGRNIERNQLHLLSETTNLRFVKEN